MPSLSQYANGEIRTLALLGSNKERSAPVASLVIFVRCSGLMRTFTYSESSTGFRLLSNAGPRGVHPASSMLSTKPERAVEGRIYLETTGHDWQGLILPYSVSDFYRCTINYLLYVALLRSHKLHTLTIVS